LIGGEIEVVVLEVDGCQVRVGISAPRGIHVLRRELLSRVESAGPSGQGLAVQEALLSLGGAKAGG
jgi:carbon storage regulator CsrA